MSDECPHGEQPRLEIVPVSLAEANTFIERHHRHAGRRVFFKATIGAACQRSRLHGVSIIARPISRHRDDGRTAEVARLCTDGTPNCASKLLAASWRVARALGYSRMGTYTLEREPGTSLEAAGWVLRYMTKAGTSNWQRHTRPGRAAGVPGRKKLYEPPGGK